MQRLRGSRWVGEGAGLEETCVHFRSGQQVNRSRCGRRTCTQTSEPCARSDCLAPCERAVGDHCNAGKPPAPDHRPSKVYLSQTKSIASASPELVSSPSLARRCQNPVNTRYWCPFADELNLCRSPDSLNRPDGSRIELAIRADDRLAEPGDQGRKPIPVTGSNGTSSCGRPAGKSGKYFGTAKNLMC